jgi:hypothetical protein
MLNDELQELLRAPREDLEIELKQWMDPTDKVVQAKLAKEMLALRNHGGGYLLIGFVDGHPPTPDPARPATLSAFDTDTFNSIVKRYAEPPFHVSSHLVMHPVSGETYPVIVVPGGAKVPVRCRADSPDDGKSVRINSYYIRRPGPESNTPQSAAEWDDLLGRCFMNRREELVSSLSALLTGGATAAPASEGEFDRLRRFRDASVDSLEKLQAEKLPAGHPAKLERGRFVFSARVVGEVKSLSPREFLEELQRLKKYTGWSPLNVFHSEGLEPYLVDDDIIECWLASKGDADAGHADFWRASTTGMVTFVRGYQEDSLALEGDARSRPLGTGFEITLPAWRVAEFILRFRDLCGRIASEPFTMQFRFEWTGLAGREVFSYGGRRLLSGSYVSHSPQYVFETTVEPNEVDSALPNVLSRIVGPLFRRFGFLELPDSLYEQELARMRGRDFG